MLIIILEFFIVLHCTFTLKKPLYLKVEQLAAYSISVYLSSGIYFLAAGIGIWFAFSYYWNNQLQCLVIGQKRRETSLWYSTRYMFRQNGSVNSSRQRSVLRQQKLGSKRRVWAWSRHHYQGGLTSLLKGQTPNIERLKILW